jgi:hypothetical protein
MGTTFFFLGEVRWVFLFLLFFLFCMVDLMGSRRLGGLTRWF